MLDHLGFNGGLPCTPSHVKSMDGVVELNPHHSLPNNLYQDYAAEGTIPLWDKYDGMTGTLFFEVKLSLKRPLSVQ